MTFKPMKLRDYERWIRKYGCSLRKAGSGDYSLINPEGKVIILFVKVIHPGNEVAPDYVKRTRKILEG